MNLINKIRATITEHQLLGSGATVVVGVSGGPDSVVLLHVLRGLAREFALNLHVAHLNHQLRGAESDADAEFVMQLAREGGLPAAGASWDVKSYGRENRLSIEEAARVLRYQFLMGTAAHVNANAIAVAHNADDQVETIVMHLIRGSGLAGLRGMAYQSEIRNEKCEIALIRPMLDVTRAEIEAYCLEHDLKPRIDASNLDTTFFRNRLRHEVIPYLEQLNPNIREVLRHTARSLSDDYDYIHQNVLGIFARMTRQITDGSAHSTNAYIFDRKWFRALPVNLQRGVLREAVTRLRRGLRNIGFTHIENARRVALDHEAGSEATLPQGLILVVGYDDFTIGEHMPLPDMPLLHGNKLALQFWTEIQLPDSEWMVRVQQTRDERRETGESRLSNKDWNGEIGNWSAVLDADAVRGQLVLRTRRAGEGFAPAGMRGKHKSLHEYMIDIKIPRHVRDLIPILADDEKVLWVCGYRVDERAKVTTATTRVLQVGFFTE